MLPYKITRVASHFQKTIMPKKSLGNKKKEDRFAKKVKKETSKQRQYDRYQREFYRAQFERGMLVRPIGFQAANTDEMAEVAIVYKLKKGYKDPFDDDSILYSINATTDKVSKKRKVQSKKERDAIMRKKASEKEKEIIFDVMDVDGEVIQSHTTLDELLKFISTLSLDDDMVD